jgi:hypothetical protein
MDRNLCIIKHETKKENGIRKIKYTRYASSPDVNSDQTETKNSYPYGSTIILLLPRFTKFGKYVLHNAVHRFPNRISYTLYVGVFQRLNYKNPTPTSVLIYIQLSKRRYLVLFVCDIPFVYTQERIVTNLCSL